MNTENLQKVLAQIEAHPETWDQTKWHCGTKHCIAGWAQILAGKPEDDATVCRDARQYLGLTMTEASVLFDRTCTLDTLRTFAAAAWYDADGFGRDGFDRSGFDRYGLDINFNAKEK